MKAEPARILLARSARAAGLAVSTEAYTRLALWLPKVSSSMLRTSQPSRGWFLGGEPWIEVVPPTMALAST